MDFETVFILALLFFIMAVSCVMVVATSMRSAQLSRLEEERYGEKASQ